MRIGELLSVLELLTNIDESEKQQQKKTPSQRSVKMAESCEKIPRLKWPCVLQPLHVQSSAFDKNYLLGS